ncbi:MAG: ribosome-associated protein [Arenicella sp.]|jgi:ribosome-associated protein
MVSKMHDVMINRQPVELYKVLKFEGLVASGGEAKMVVAEGLVSVNGEIEMRKRCKLKAGDIVEFNGESFRLVLDYQTD